MTNLIEAGEGSDIMMDVGIKESRITSESADVAGSVSVRAGECSGAGGSSGAGVNGKRPGNSSESIFISLFPATLVI